MARNKASARQFNRRSISARSVLRSSQATTVCLRPSYRQITVSLFYQRYHRTAIRIMIKLVRPTARSSHVCRHPARPPDDLPVSLLLPGICSIVCLPISRPSTRTLAWQLQPLSPLAGPFAGRPRSLRLPSTARSSVPGRFSDSHRDAAAIDCPLFPRSRVDVSGGHVSTCCLMKMVPASSLDSICMVCSSIPSTKCHGRN